MEPLRYHHMKPEEVQFIIMIRIEVTHVLFSKRTRHVKKKNYTNHAARSKLDLISSNREAIGNEIHEPLYFTWMIKCQSDEKPAIMFCMCLTAAATNGTQ